VLGTTSTNCSGLLAAENKSYKHKMCGDNLKAVLLAAVSGFFSGCVTVLLFAFLSPTALDYCGVPFILAIAVSLFVSRQHGWLNFTSSLRRYSAAGILIFSTYPLIRWVFPIIEAISLSLNHTPRSFSLWTDWSDLQRTATIVIVCTITSSIALWIISSKWSMKAFFLLVIGATMVVWIALASTLLLADFGYSVRINSEDWTFVSLLMILGETILGAVSAEWIASSSKDRGTYMQS
jgi:RsiW-degrading membrane proteinase PrsW (M82 family)